MASRDDDGADLVMELHPVEQVHRGYGGCYGVEGVGDHQLGLVIRKMDISKSTGQSSIPVTIQSFKLVKKVLRIWEGWDLVTNILLHI